MGFPGWLASPEPKSDGPRKATCESVNQARQVRQGSNKQAAG